MRREERDAREAPGRCEGPRRHGLPANKMAPITSDCDAMRVRDRRMALNTSGCLAALPAAGVTVETEEVD